MVALTGLLLFIIGGMAWRIRGQAEPWSDTVSRFVIWGGSIGTLVFALTGNPLYTIGSILLAGVGATIGYAGQYDFSVSGNWNIKNYALLTLTAMFRFVPVLIAAVAVKEEWHILPAVLAGVSFVPIYMFAFKCLSKLNFGPLFNQPSCWAEFLFGGIIYTALAAGLHF